MIGVPAALLLLPVVLALAIGSLVAYRAWPFFVQRRLARDGRTFRFVKIRSLPTFTPPTADKYVIGLIPNTRWGRFIRTYHLDEIPQLWHVVSGQMSLVGPRPEMPEVACRFDPSFVRIRQTVRPGCTGLWQISSAASALIGEAPEYDLHYIENWTLRLDLWTLARSVREIAGGQSLTSLDDIPAWTGAAPDYAELVA